MWNIYKESVRKNLSDAMEHYVGCTRGLNMKEMSNKKLRLLQKDTIAFLAWVHLKRTQNKGGSAEKDTTYEKILPAVLAVYVDSTLCLSKIMSTKRRLEESSTILLKISLLLSSNTHLYLDVLLQLRSLDKTHLDLLRPICRKCLTQKSNSDPETYTKYLVVYKKLSSLWPKELSSELLEASTLLPPMNYLKWLEKVDRKALSSLNIQNTQNDKKIRDGLMNHRNVSVLDSIVNTLFKKIKALPQPAMSGDSDSEDISYLSDDEHVLRKKFDGDAESISSSDDEDVSFWSKKRDIIDDPSSSSMQDSGSDDVILMETESTCDSTLESDDVDISSEKGEGNESQNSFEAIDLTCEDEEGNSKSGDFVDNKISDRIESSVVEVSTNVVPINNTFTSPEPKASNLKRKYDDDSDDVEDDVPIGDSEHHCKRAKLSLGLEADINLNIEDSKDKGVMEEPNVTTPVEALFPTNLENESDAMDHMDVGLEEDPIKDTIEEKISEDFDSEVRPREEPEESEIKESNKISNSVLKEENMKENPSEDILKEKVPEDFNASTLENEEILCDEPEESETKESIESLSANDDEEGMKEDSSENIFEEKFPEDFYTSFITITEGAHDKPQETEKKDGCEILIGNDGAKTLFDGKASKSKDLMRDLPEDSEVIDEHESKEKEHITVDGSSSKPSDESKDGPKIPIVNVAKDDSNAVKSSSLEVMASFQSESSIHNLTRQTPPKRLQSPTLSKSNSKSLVISGSERLSSIGKNEAHKELLNQLLETPAGPPLTYHTTSAFASLQSPDLSCPSITHVDKSEQHEHAFVQLSKISDKSSDSVESSEISLSIEQTAGESSQQKYSLRSLKVSKIAQPGPKTRIRKPATKDSKSSTTAEILVGKKSNEETESSNVVTLEDVTDLKTAAKEASEISQAGSQTSSTSLKRSSQPKVASRIPRWSGKDEEPESQENLNPALRRSARIQGKGSKN